MKSYGILTWFAVHSRTFVLKLRWKWELSFCSAGVPVHVQTVKHWPFVSCRCFNHLSAVIFRPANHLWENCSEQISPQNQKNTSIMNPYNLWICPVLHFSTSVTRKKKKRLVGGGWKSVSQGMIPLSGKTQQENIPTQGSTSAAPLWHSRMISERSVCVCLCLLVFTEEALWKMNHFYIAVIHQH